MLNLIKASIIVAASFFITANSSFAQDYMLGQLTIQQPHARATVEGAPVSGGFLTIINQGSEDDRLVAVSVDFAGKTEIHEMSMEGDVMKMRPLEDGLVIPAGGSVTLKPGGFHIMFMMLKEQLKPEEDRVATLTFEKAGTIEVSFMVEDTATIMQRAKEMGAMDHKAHQHGQ